MTPARDRALVQFNVAHLRAPLDSPALADFVAALERINALADRSPGFLWRLQDDAGDATAMRPYGDGVLLNLSVWSDAASLRNYVYRSEHAEFLKRRREWFRESGQIAVVLFWIPGAHRPSPQEAMARLMHLRTHGPSPEAFGFREAERYP